MKNFVFLMTLFSLLHFSTKTMNNNFSPKLSLREINRVNMYNNNSRFRLHPSNFRRIKIEINDLINTEEENKTFEQNFSVELFYNVISNVQKPFEKHEVGLNLNKKNEYILTWKPFKKTKDFITYVPKENKNLIVIKYLQNSRTVDFFIRLSENNENIRFESKADKIEVYTLDDNDNKKLYDNNSEIYKKMLTFYSSFTEYLNTNE